MFSFLQVLTCSGVQFVPGAVSQVKKVEERGEKAIFYLFLLPRPRIFRICLCSSVYYVQVAVFNYTQA